MSDEQIEAFKSADPEILNARQLLLCRAAEELVQDFCISDVTWNALSANYTDEDMIEAVSLAAAYVCMAMFTRSFGVQLEGKESFEGFAAIRSYQ